MICSAVKVTKSIRNIEDAFSKELISLWDKRGMTGRVFWVEDKDGTIVSYVLVEEQGIVNTIRGLFVIESARGKGIGTKTVEMVCRFYTEMGAETMIVNITDGAEHIYERNGFEILGRRKDYVDQKIAFKGTLTEKIKKDLKSKIEKEH